VWRNSRRTDQLVDCLECDDKCSCKVTIQVNLSNPCHMLILKTHYLFYKLGLCVPLPTFASQPQPGDAITAGLIGLIVVIRPNSY